MINTLLLTGIMLFFIYAFYDQFGMDKLYGETLLKVRLKKRAKIDGVIFIALLAILIYQSIDGLTSLSFYLLTTIIILTIYAAFIRYPVLLLKPTGFFYGNIFIRYAKIRAINQTEDHFLVIDLINGKRLLVLIENPKQLTATLEVLAQLNIIVVD